MHVNARPDYPDALCADQADRCELLALLAWSTLQAALITEMYEDLAPGLSCEASTHRFC
jgi:hypothetical protein